MTQQQISQRDLSRPVVHPYAHAIEAKPAWFWNYEDFAMDWSDLGRWEWLLIEVLVLGWAIRELVSIRRERRRAAEAERRAAEGQGQS